MGKAKVRVAVVFVTDYAVHKKGDTIEVSRSLAHSLIDSKVATLPKSGKAEKAETKKVIKE